MEIQLSPGTDSKRYESCWRLIISVLSLGLGRILYKYGRSYGDSGKIVGHSFTYYTPHHHYRIL